MTPHAALSFGPSPNPQLLHAGNLSPVTDLTSQPTLLAVAAHFAAKDRGMVSRRGRGRGLLWRCVANAAATRPSADLGVHLRG
jgi:hypothetical protein